MFLFSCAHSVTCDSHRPFINCYTSQTQEAALLRLGSSSADMIFSFFGRDVRTRRSAAATLLSFIHWEPCAVTFSFLRSLTSLRQQDVDLLRIFVLYEGEEKTSLRTTALIVPHSPHAGLSIHYTMEYPNLFSLWLNICVVRLGVACTLCDFLYSFYHCLAFLCCG